MGSGVSLDQEQLAQLRDEVTTLKNSLTEAEAKARELERVHVLQEEPEFVFSDGIAYEKLKVIGKGASAVCYAVRRKSDNKDFVVKQLQVPLEELALKQGFADEVKVMGRFNHPSVIALYDSYIQNSVLHILMEYASGGTIYHRITKAAREGTHFDEEQILRWFTQTMMALKHVHDHKILHRDVTTKNIFLTEDGNVKLGDFGISKMLSTQTHFASTVIGTPNYLSPEIWDGREYDAKSDIWALGCVLCELCGLQKSFTQPDIPSMMAAISNGNYNSVPAHYSPVVKNLVAAILQPNPDNRPSIHQLLNVPCLSPYIRNEEERVVKCFQPTISPVPRPPSKAFGGPRLSRAMSNRKGCANTHLPPSPPPPPRGVAFIRKAAGVGTKDR